jgi:hypothetical protein
VISKTLERKITKLAHASLDLVSSRHRHFSFITKRNTIVSYGYNKTFRTHPLASVFNHRFNDIHSELSALINFPYGKDLSNYQFINIRIRRDNNGLGLARPCKCCKHMLAFFGVKEILYTNEFGNWDYEKIYS